MRERTEIEREMFHARQDLEANLERLIHRTREQFAVRARAAHAVESHRTKVLVAIGVIAVIALVAYPLLRSREWRSTAQARTRRSGR